MGPPILSGERTHYHNIKKNLSFYLAQWGHCKMKNSEAQKKSSDLPKVSVSDRARALDNWLPDFLLDRLFKSCGCQRAYGNHIAENSPGFTCLWVQSRSHEQFPKLCQFGAFACSFRNLFIPTPKSRLPRVFALSCTGRTCSSPAPYRKIQLPCLCLPRPGSSLMRTEFCTFLQTGFCPRMSTEVWGPGMRPRCERTA